MSRHSFTWLLALACTAAAQDYRWPLHAIAGEDPRAVVVADFDLDGRLDFATAQFDSNDVSVVLAAPGGGYEPPINLPDGKQFSDLGVGDFDLDGRPDLVATNRLDPWLRLYDNASGWTWCGAQGAIVADALAVGDMNGDGRPDVVVADSWTSQARVFLTDAGGCPTAPLSFATGAKPIDVALADLDGDGALDVVTCNETASTLSLLRGTGTGSLLPATSVAVGSVPSAVVAADLDQDGDADVAVSSSAAKTVRLFLNDGAGGLVGGTSFNAPSGHRPTRLVADDVDADGVIDLVAALSFTVSAGGFAVLRGTGGGAFAASVLHDSGIINAGALAVADMDEDGHLDVLLDATEDSIFIAPGDGAGGFTMPAGPSMPALTFASSLGDLNGDGLDDLVSSSFAKPWAETVSVQLGDGAGGYLPAVEQAAGASGPLDLVDLNGDGALDLLGRTQGTALAGALGDGLGGLGPTTTSSSIMPHQTVAADIDGDGLLDVILDGEEPGLSGDKLFVVRIYRGDGTGAFVPDTLLLSYDLWHAFGGDPAPPHGHVGAGDLDGDGDADVVFSGKQQTRVWLNNAGSLGAGTAISAGNGYAFGIDPLRLADFDGDGRLDLLTVNEHFASVLHGDGAGGFGPAIHLAPIAAGSSIAVADVDGDGRLDVVVGRNDAPETITVLRNDGAGGAQARSYYTFGATRLFVTDADSDGFTDVMTDAFGQNRLLLNQALLGAWTDLGSGLAGVDGVPKLVGTGTLGFHTPGSLKLSHANPSKLAALVIATTSTPTPFKGGVLVPVPPIASFLLVTSPAGTLELSWSSWPSPGPAGATWFFQYAIGDAAAPSGVSLSNAVRGTQPGP